MCGRISRALVKVVEFSETIIHARTSPTQFTCHPDDSLHIGPSGLARRACLCKRLEISQPLPKWIYIPLVVTSLLGFRALYSDEKLSDHQSDCCALLHVYLLASGLRCGADKFLGTQNFHDRDLLRQFFPENWTLRGYRHPVLLAELDGYFSRSCDHSAPWNDHLHDLDSSGGLCRSSSQSRRSS